MHFTSETSSNGVVERTFLLDDVTGVLWSPESGSAGAPLLLLGHSGGMHKRAPGLVATALHGVIDHGFTVVAIDAPGHGDRERSDTDRQRGEAIQRARAAGEPIAPIVADHSVSIAERAVPEWQSTLDALQALPGIDSSVPVGFGGMMLGVATGMMLTAADTRIGAVGFGAVFVNDALLDAARQVTVPVEYRIPWDDEHLDRGAALALFDAFASGEKSLHARSGRIHPAPDHERADSVRFFARHLSPSSR
ncbi:alpha/beta hydrolase [Rhodococcus gannanensis]|uniref:Alpha/beta hydrolase n=1 Tax=Rhodococcus gannanensis TaxID=1960308 RepID=A0ABW4P7L6_9NOCA